MNFLSEADSTRFQPAGFAPGSSSSVGMAKCMFDFGSYLLVFNYESEWRSNTCSSTSVLLQPWVSG